MCVGTTYVSSIGCTQSSTQPGSHNLNVVHVVALNHVSFENIVCDREQTQGWLVLYVAQLADLSKIVHDERQHWQISKPTVV